MIYNGGKQKWDGDRSPVAETSAQNEGSGVAGRATRLREVRPISVTTTAKVPCRLAIMPSRVAVMLMPVRQVRVCLRRVLGCTTVVYGISSEGRNQARSGNPRVSGGSHCEMREKGLASVSGAALPSGLRIITVSCWSTSLRAIVCETSPTSEETLALAISNSVLMPRMNGRGSSMVTNGIAVMRGLQAYLTSLASASMAFKEHLVLVLDAYYDAGR